MARSYKKYPGFSDGDRPKKWNKKQANKKVRKFFDLSDGCNYKKLYERWNICDYNNRFYSKSHLLKYIDEEEIYKFYMK